MKNNKKFIKIAAGAAALVMAFSMTACGGNGDKGNSSSGGGTSGGGTSSGGTITASFAAIETLGDNFDSRYYPNASAVKKYSGTIDVVLDFDSNVDGWKAVAAEYERLQSGAVKININTNFSGTNYVERLNSELNDYTRTGWDLVEGNLGGSNTNKSCVSVKSFSSDYNAYCGENVRWSTVLEDNAFKNVESGSDDSYIVNTEDMQTAWFINDVAFKAAVEKGYLNSEGKAEYPVTWNDLISLCDKMEEAGYTNPLGISLSEGSIQSSQFSWLLRVYGDYYYRQYYEYIMASETWDGYDPTDTNPEYKLGYGVKWNKIANIMLDTETTVEAPGYVGAESDVFADFITNLAKMKGHLMLDTAKTEFNDVKDKFSLQTSGKSSPQIFLDYLGNGIIYKTKENDSFKLGYFDYPQMESEYVDSDTITRDIGGNGGFISVVKKLDANQNELNIDFLKFYLSPYGQTFYYKGLSDKGVAPKGLSTVKNNLFSIDKTWTDFYTEAGKTVKFNGNVDGNLFLSFGVRYFFGLSNVDNYIVSGYRGLLMENMGSSAKTVDQFTSEWSARCMLDYEEKCKESGWNKEMYKDFYGNPS